MDFDELLQQMRFEALRNQHKLKLERVVKEEQVKAVDFAVAMLEKYKTDSSFRAMVDGAFDANLLPQEQRELCAITIEIFYRGEKNGR